MEPEEIIKPPLRFWHGLKGVAFAVMATFFFGAALYALQAFGVALESWYMMVFQTAVIGSIFTGAALLVLHPLGIPLFKGVALHRSPLFPTLIAAAGVLPVGMVCDQAVSFLHQWRPDFFSASNMENLSGIMQNAPMAGFVLLALAVSVFPAVGEEFMFRGLVFRSFKKDMPVYFAAIYSAVLFGLVHFDWLQGTAAGLLGLYLAYAVYTTGSILPAVIGHFVNNLTWCLFSRYDAEGIQDVFANGYSSSEVLVSSLLSVGVIAVLWVFRKRPQTVG